MCHLAVEKALKGLYQLKYEKIPEKSHNLVFFLEKLELDLPEHLGRFLVTLNSASVTIRYPESLKIISAQFTQVVTVKILAKAKEVVQWIKRKY